MYIELFVVAGQNVELENTLKKAVEDIRSKVQRPDKVRLATVKIRPDAVDQVVRLVGESPEKVPPHYRSLVNMLKKYGVSKFPAVVIDGTKIGEGDIDVNNVLAVLQERARSEFPELASLELVPPRPVPAPPQPVVVPAREVEPRPLVEAVEQPPEPRVEVRIPEPPRPPVELRPPEPPKLPEPRPEVKTFEPVLKPVLAAVRLVLGRPDNCSECAYFGNLTSRCFLFGFAVSAPSSPPCKQYVRSGG